MPKYKVTVEYMKTFEIWAEDEEVAHEMAQEEAYIPGTTIAFIDIIEKPID